jgi:hypothetical protein
VDDILCARWLAGLGGDQGLLSLARKLVPDVLGFPSGRLGILFELYVHALLRSWLGDSRVDNGIPVRTGKKETWGELDTLLVTEKGHLEHWELSVKFYLQVEKSPAWRHCVGPGLVDRLDLKGPKTFLQQLPLSATEEAVGAILKVFPWSHGRVHARRAFAKGTIFYRLDSPGRLPWEAWKDGVPPRGLPQGHGKGWWVDESRLSLVREALPDATVTVLPRLRWMGGLAKGEALRAGVPWEFFLERLPALLESAQSRNECPFLAFHDAATGAELTRGFIATPRFLAGLRACDAKGTPQL